MKILKRYTKNLHRSKASIIERYITEKAIEFCFESRHNERVRGKGSRGLHVINPSLKELQQTHLYILNNINEVLP